VRIVFTREARGATLATIYRPDSVVVGLNGSAHCTRVPHDLAHAVAERELGLAQGIFGSLAAGAMFSSVVILSGRPRYDAAERSKRILAANTRELHLTELFGGALQSAVDESRLTSAKRQARQYWNSLSTVPFPYSDEQFDDAAYTLDLLNRAWQQLRIGQGMDFVWPARLISPVPRPAPRRREAGSRLQRIT
jgi:hypothetical protein